MKIDWKKYDSNLTEIDLRCNNITEMNWEFCPPGLTRISINNNHITEMNWKFCPRGLTKINLCYNKITEMDFKGCPPGLTRIYFSITKIDWEGCRNEFISDIYPYKYYKEYLEYKKTDAFIPYLPIVSKLKKEIHYELESIWWRCPDGILFKEDVKELKDSGYF